MGVNSQHSEQIRGVGHTYFEIITLHRQIFVE